jgi:tRNA pseudouridine38-40 synthase
LRLDLSYDGTAFHGWAVQTELRTVQGELMRVLSMLTREHIEIYCAGRTDAGVHARGQVAHLDVTQAQWDALEDAGRVNRALPDDIRIHRMDRAPQGFDARFAAIWRRYTYRVCDHSTRMNPLLRHQTLAFHHRLDIDAMNEAAQGLLGLHDFAAYCKPRDYSSTVRQVQSLAWHREDASCVMTIQADAFCHSMVRSIVGAMLPVGDGRKPVSWPAQVLAGGERNVGVTVMPPHPLVLEEVGYPADDELAARQRITRDLRTLDCDCEHSD